MPRRKRTPEEIARKERTKALMKELDIKDMDDIQDLFKSFVAAALSWSRAWWGVLCGL